MHASFAKWPARQAVRVVGPIPVSPSEVADTILIGHHSGLLPDVVTASISLECGIATATTGQHVLQQVTAIRPNAALLSIDLQDPPATEVLKQINTMTVEDRPVLVAFGPHNDVRLRAARTHGWADGIVELPCSVALFLNRFWRIVDARRSQLNVLNDAQLALVRLGERMIGSFARAAASDEPLDETVVDTLCRSLIAAAHANQLDGILNALKSHHAYTLVHVLKVAATMTVFGVALDMRESDLLLLAQAGLLHDVGKSAIPFEILEKPAPLDDQEWHVMRQHPRLSGEILRRNPVFAEDVVRVAENHHEKLDGSGYPRALKGIEIDDLSLVCAIIDVYGALTDKRSYKRRCSSGEALEIMRTMTETHLDPSFFARFEEMVLDGVIL